MSHRSRIGVICIDCETDDLGPSTGFRSALLGKERRADDDVKPEVACATTLDASEVARVKTWNVMEAPSGHRFCSVPPQGGDFPGDAKEFD